MDQQREKTAPRFRCEVCHQGFTRTDHLKRHALRHSGLKPYVCSFCEVSFARCDSLRNHYSDCTKRGDRPIPETDQKGRRRHACVKCISMKLKCDGNNPCGSCQKRGLSCEHVDRPSPVTTPVRATLSTASSIAGGSVPPQPDPCRATPTTQRAGDITSIKFLLNGGQDGFMEDWDFPGRRYPTTASSPAAKTQIQSPITPFSSAPQVNFSIDPNFAQMGVLPRGAFTSFFDNPFEAYQQQWQRPLSGGPGSDALWQVNTDSPDSCDYVAYPELHSPNIANLRDSMLITLAKLSLAPQKQQELRADLQFLLAPQRVHRFVHNYGKIWHPNCPIIHMATFNIERVTLHLLAAIVSMGAMYSVDQRELSAAKNILDLVEVFVFDTELFSSQAEIRRAMADPAKASTPPPVDWLEFQNFQAAYLNVVVQHWAGNKLARDRSMEIRFGQIVRVARAMSLHKARHVRAGEGQLDSWIQKECQIRTINIIHSIDCAFLFFHNYPCKLSFAEMDCDLPCDELLFSCPNPFAEPAFKFSRGITLRRGFESLFETDSPMAPGGEHFRMLDMFLLIHVLYAYIITRLVLRAPFGSSLPPSERHASPSKAVVSGYGGSGSRMGAESSDPVIARILTALQRWNERWNVTCKSTSQDAIAVTGFFRGSYKFFIVAHLVASKHEQVEGGWLLEPKCPNKLERLQALAG